MSTVKTKAGTELPLLNLKGKEYLQAAHRILWFREERPLWSIETEFLQITADVAIAKATVKDEAGRIIATAHKSETPAGFPDYIEKSETGAIARAMALIGFGTQFAQELEEGERLADSPQSPKGKPNLQAVPGDPGSYVMKMGKAFTGKRLDECGPHDLDGFAKWLVGQEKQTALSKETVEAISAFLATREVPRAK